MFKEVEIIYTVICDECGLDCCDDTPYIGWKNNATTTNNNNRAINRRRGKRLKRMDRRSK